jgi:organic hydroperoxide reductase OsmC/OhrA
MSSHRYEVITRWTGNRGSGTSEYRAYGREHEIAAPSKTQAIPGSSDAYFRGDGARYNPEELLVASLSACHMLWYLHLCADAGIVVVAYADTGQGTMVEDQHGGGRFTEVVLNPRATITRAEQAQEALALHAKAHQLCFIANSVNFPVRHVPEVTVARDGAETPVPPGVRVREGFTPSS